MEKRKTGWFLAVAAFALCVYFALYCAVGVRFAVSIPDGIVVSPRAVASANYGAVSCKLDMSEQGAEEGKGKLSFRLFGLIPIKTIDILCSKDRQVRIGGFPVGLTLDVDGVLVEEVGNVATSVGNVAIDGNIEKGDIILSLNDRKIASVDDFTAFMDGYDGLDKLYVTLNRNGRILKVCVSPLIEELSGKYKLGLWVKDSVSGVGTASFVRADNTFACLGHGITGSNDCVLPICGGRVYNCDIIGVNRGVKGTPGELKGVLKDTDKPIGEIYKNTDYGVYGKYFSNANIPENYYQIGSRINVRNGKAKIYTSVNGTADFYDIEIIRAIPQSERSDRSMVVRVTDKRLLELTGGIVRGMSGSPIIQNDMIVGAITHVFVNDPTKGYGLYLDWMY